jgi:hypothetical protein
MTPKTLDEMTITVKRAAAIIVFLFSVYFAAMKGVNDGFDKVNEKHAMLQTIVSQNSTQLQVIANDITYLKRDVSIIMTYREATLPEKPVLKNIR